MDKESERYFEITPRSAFSFGLQEMIQYKELFYFFTWRDVKVKYRQAVLGLLWVVLQPVMMMLVFTFFFGRALGSASGSIPYPVFAFSGFLLWSTFATSVTTASNSMNVHSGIIQKIYFPRLIIPVSAILVALVDFAMALIAFIVFILFYPVSINIFKLLICWPLAIGLMILGSFGIGCWLSALTIKFRDFRFITPFMIQILFFLTPIVYPLSVVKIAWINYLLAVNPIYGAIAIFRIPFMSELPDLLLVGISFLSALIFAIIGVGYFKRTELFFADLS